MIYDNIIDINNISHGCALTVGMFDGVHTGHRHLLHLLQSEASRRGLRPLVVTFDRHPRQALGGQMELLMHHDYRLRTLESLGFDVVVIRFDAPMATLSACEFTRKYLHKQLGMKLLVLGYDNRFGSRQKDDFDQLPALAQELGFDIVQDEAVSVEGLTVSSTKVRQALIEGQVKLAQKLLGEEYTLTGNVVPGRHVGHTLGFPTANVQIEAQLLPMEGAYAIRARIEGQPDTLHGMVNIGPQPTFGSENKTVEVHLFTPCGDLYGRRLSISFVARLRDIRRFDSPEALVAQLKEDQKRSIELLNS